MKRGRLSPFLFAAIWLSLLTSGMSQAWAEDGRSVAVLSIRGVIDPFTAQHVRRGLDIAQREGAQALVIELDTPGGGDVPMRSIVQDLLNAPLPVVVYVWPSGARAGSAGVFIALAAHLAAMSPGTNIGAAHPVVLGTGELGKDMDAKLTNDAAAYIRSIAEARGHNATWAEEAVRKSVSITEREALEKGVIDLVANDLEDLLNRLDGQKAVTTNGEQVLHTKGARLRRVQMTLPALILHRLVDPNIAYILMTLGLWGLIAEFYHPGAIFPGVAGAISLILAFVALGSLPVNWGGVVLIITAVILFLLDIKVAGFGLSIGGVIAFVLGSLMLFSPFSPPSPSMPRFYVNRPLVAGVTAALTAFFLLALSAGLRAQRVKVRVGMKAFIGQTGVATSTLDPLGTVLVQSESWSAIAEDGPIQEGQKVEVVGWEGLKLKVLKHS